MTYKTSTAFLLLLFANPLILLIAIIVGLAFIALAIGAIIYYGLLTAIVLLCTSGFAIVFLQYVKVINLKETPIVIVIPLVLFVAGIGLERFSVLNAASMLSSSVTLSAQETLIAEILIVALIITSICIIVAKRR